MLQWVEAAVILNVKHPLELKADSCLCLSLSSFCPSFFSLLLWQNREKYSIKDNLFCMYFLIVRLSSFLIFLPFFFFFLSFCLSLCLYVSLLSVCFVYFFVFFHLSAFLPVCFSVFFYLFVCLFFIQVSVHLSVFCPMFLFVFLFFWQCFWFSVFLVSGYTFTCTVKLWL